MTVQYVFFIGGGHGPNTPGKRAPDDSYREFHFTKPTAERLGALLQTYENVKVYYLHDLSGKTDVPLSVRIEKANSFYRANKAKIERGDMVVIYISIHSNAGSGGWSSARGSETWIYRGSSSGRKIAAKIESEVSKITGQKTRGIKESGVLDEVELTKMPAVIHEAAFHTNREDLELLKSKLFREQVAAGLENAIVDLYGLKRKAAAKQTVQKEAVKVEDTQQSYFKDSQEWVKEQKISDGSNPKGPVTREQLWEMLYRMETGKRSEEA